MPSMLLCIGGQNEIIRYFSQALSAPGFDYHVKNDTREEKRFLPLVLQKSAVEKPQSANIYYPNDNKKIIGKAIDFRSIW